MALTTEDLQNIKQLLDNRLEPFERRFDEFATATRAELNDISNVLDDIKDDVAVVKDIVKDHSFRIARLEQRIAPAN